MNDFPETLAAAMRRFAGEGELSSLSRLSGGANMESWAFDWGSGGSTAAYVLRRAPSAAYMADRPFGHADEAALVKAARAGGVKAPEVVGVLEEADGLGTGYVMRRVIAEVVPAKILGDPPPSLLADLGRELAHIHALSLPAIPPAIPHMDTVEALAALKARFLGYGGDRPVIALAIRWCEDHLPAPARPAAWPYGALAGSTSRRSVWGASTIISRPMRLRAAARSIATASASGSSIVRSGGRSVVSRWGRRGAAAPTRRSSASSSGAAPPSRNST